MRPSVTALFALVAGASAELEVEAAQQAAVDCINMNCPEGIDVSLYSYSYMSDDDWIDLSDLCDSIEGNSEFMYACQSADATCSECQSEMRAFTEVSYEQGFTSIGVDCDLECPAYGATTEDTHDGHDGHDHGDAVPEESDGAAKIGAAAASALAAAFAFL